MTIDEKLEENGVDVDGEDIIVFRDPDYARAAIGISSNGNVVYDYDAMLECLIDEEGMSEEDAADWLSYNTSLNSMRRKVRRQNEHYYYLHRIQPNG